MSNDVPVPAISIKNVSKSYKVYEKASDVLRETLFGRGKYQTVNALTDISLDVYRGEILGILGANGAGKTTLLKVLCGVINASKGDVVINGRISQMLELGTGFHPDYSGHDNIYLGGYCQGMTKAEVEEKYDEIVAFSELSEDEIKRPFKTYSAGMQARLTFAVAIHVNAEILIVDEWLAVGDARFALKCYDRIRKFRDEGVTVIFVTHNYTTLTEFCNRGIVLAKGEKVFEGTPTETITKYQEVLFNKPNTTDVVNTEVEEESVGKTNSIFNRFKSLAQLNEKERTGNQSIKMTGVSLLSSSGQVTNTLRSLDGFKVIVEYTVKKSMSRPIAGLFIRNGLGTILSSTGTNLVPESPFPEHLNAGEIYRISYDLHNSLAGGNYFVGLAIAEQGGEQYDKADNYFMLTVLPTQRTHTDVSINLDPKVSTFAL